MGKSSRQGCQSAKNSGFFNETLKNATFCKKKISGIFEIGKVAKLFFKSCLGPHNVLHLVFESQQMVAQFLWGPGYTDRLNQRSISRVLFLQ